MSHNDMLDDAITAARRRLLVPHEDLEARAEALILAQIQIENAIVALHEASTAACRADAHLLADEIDAMRHGAGLLSVIAKGWKHE